ncbi:MAG TPA: hypothetical protein ENK99_02910 [Campylobacterales bacterium]|nr:hypothetical protein [Campylobacterales bacterium]
MLSVALVMLLIIGFNGILTPIVLFILLCTLGCTLIVVFAKDSQSLKLKLFLLFFSTYLVYIMIHDYVLINVNPDYRPIDYIDENTFYHYTFVGLPYISGERNFLDIFSVFEINETILHTIISSSIAYLSVAIDGKNTLIVQKLLSPFLGGLFSVVLFSTIYSQFQNKNFAVKSTLAYGFLSAVFMYSTTILRDIDIALLYMMVFYLFLETQKLKNIFLIGIIAYITMYLRFESGMVLFALLLLYIYFYVKELESKKMKMIFYILFSILSGIVLLLVLPKIIHVVGHLNEANTTRSISAASSGSIGLLLNKLPFPMSYVAKVIFGQMQPFPFFKAIDRPLEVISSVFWPFIFLMMNYAFIKKDIRKLIDIKIKFLLFIAIAILFLMSSEPMVRRMMSVYPIIYLVSLYAFVFISSNKIKKIFYYYLFAMIFITTLYFFVKG